MKHRRVNGSQAWRLVRREGVTRRLGEESPWGGYPSEIRAINSHPHKTSGKTSWPLDFKKGLEGSTPHHLDSFEMRLWVGMLNHHLYHMNLIHLLKPGFSVPWSGSFKLKDKGWAQSCPALRDGPSHSPHFIMQKRRALNIYELARDEGPRIYFPEHKRALANKFLYCGGESMLFVAEEQKCSHCEGFGTFCVNSSYLFLHQIK